MSSARSWALSPIHCTAAWSARRAKIQRGPSAMQPPAAGREPPATIRNKSSEASSTLDDSEGSVTPSNTHLATRRRALRNSQHLPYVEYRPPFPHTIDANLYSTLHNGPTGSRSSLVVRNPLPSLGTFDATSTNTPTCSRLEGVEENSAERNSNKHRKNATGGEARESWRASCRFDQCSPKSVRLDPVSLND